jgi:hypothetical protein
VSGNIKIAKSSLKNDSYKTQRQRLRKVGPFAIGSQSIPDDSKMKYAGQWPPNNHDDSDDDNDDTQAQNNNSYDARPVRIWSCIYDEN